MPVPQSALDQKEKASRIIRADLRQDEHGPRGHQRAECGVRPFSGCGGVGNCAGPHLTVVRRLAIGRPSPRMLRAIGGDGAIAVRPKWFICAQTSPLPSAWRRSRYTWRAREGWFAPTNSAPVWLFSVLDVAVALRHSRGLCALCSRRSGDIDLAGSLHSQRARDNFDAQWERARW